MKLFGKEKKIFRAQSNNAKCIYGPPEAFAARRGQNTEKPSGNMPENKDDTGREREVPENSDKGENL